MLSKILFPLAIFTIIMVLLDVIEGWVPDYIPKTPPKFALTKELPNKHIMATSFREHHDLSQDGDWGFPDMGGRVHQWGVPEVDHAPVKYHTNQKSSQGMTRQTCECSSDFSRSYFDVMGGEPLCWGTGRQ